MKNYKTTGQTIIKGKPFAGDMSVPLSEEDAKGYVKAGTLVEVDENGKPVATKSATKRKTTAKD
ncbi:hypothetical protein GCM10007094_23850 [Pseudovibrio japonicus]|uniref:Uncharacterized protein n=1 Tax=Pseudovibrio japonicus TaxID=366534 RepID=A0ABQ3EDG3_9HYPH|nr:hypothetical protein [Pseudovibrio japonicus]GHB34052.1 hypothetical protein GCM10007094_23850 [Pseudovibrio japonicus]